MLTRIFVVSFGFLMWGCSDNGASTLKGELGNGGNPFATGNMYVSPLYIAKVQNSIDQEPAMAAQLKKVQYVSTSYWIDKIGTVPKIIDFLNGARQRLHDSGQAVSVSFVIYDLPDRDCAAGASNGELSGSDGLVHYKHDYIDALAAIFASYSDLEIVAFVEPDSLANIATNMGVQKCAQAASNYKEGVAYAVKQLHGAGAVLYLDAAHSGWLGWNDNRSKMANVVKEVLDMAGSTSLIRGFVTNLANYTPLDLPQNFSSLEWFDQSNPAEGERSFVQLMTQNFAAVGITQIGFVIDTSRNGVIDSRRIWGNWCNIARAGMGERPQANPAAGIDAYMWIKTPGESDGSSDASNARYDYSCSSGDSLLGAPEAGAWFHNQFILLAQHASPSL